MQLCCDQSGWKASDFANYVSNTYPGLFTDFPGKFVVINLGANQDSSTTVFQSSLQTVITAAENAGKTVILEKCVSSNEAWIASYNTVISALYTANSSVIPGADMSAFQFNYSGPHPDANGAATQRIVRAQFACQLS